MTIVEAARGVTGGVDTHLDVHVAAALDPLGGLLGTERFETNAAGYKALLAWLETFGNVTKIGIEGTGSYGAGLARHLRRVGVEVIEVDRPNREERRRSGKSDPLDAVEAIPVASLRPETVGVRGRLWHGGISGYCTGRIMTMMRSATGPSDSSSAK